MMQILCGNTKPQILQCTNAEQLLLVINAYQYYTVLYLTLEEI